MQGWADNGIIVTSGEYFGRNFGDSRLIYLDLQISETSKPIHRAQMKELEMQNYAGINHHLGKIPDVMCCKPVLT